MSVEEEDWELDVGEFCPWLEAQESVLFGLQILLGLSTEYI